MEIKSDGYFVVCPNGQIGLAVDDKPHPTNKKWRVITVQFGSGGPFRDIVDRSLRYATEQEVKDADLWGVGGNIGP